MDTLLRVLTRWIAKNVVSEDVFEGLLSTGGATISATFSCSLRWNSIWSIDRSGSCRFELYTWTSKLRIDTTTILLLRLLLLLRHPFNGLFPGQPGLAGSRKVNHSGFYWSKRWWGGSGISLTICKSFAPRSRQITTPAPHHSVFYRPGALPATQPTASKHWRHTVA